jgi:hypothetical protein
MQVWRYRTKRRRAATSWVCQISCEVHELTAALSDTGTTKLIIDGSIKLKNDALIQEFDKDGLIFDNGTKLGVDVVICATGYVPTTYLFEL